MTIRRVVSASTFSSSRPERVRLAGSRLPAHEGVPVEAAAVELRGHPRGEQELADHEAGPITAPSAVQPGADLVGQCRAGERVVEGAAAVEEQPAADRPADEDARRHAGSRLDVDPVVAARQLGDLPEPVAVLVLEDDVRPPLELQAVERRLELEGRAVHRGREGQGAALDPAAEVAVALRTGPSPSRRDRRPRPCPGRSRTSRSTPAFDLSPSLPSLATMGAWCVSPIACETTPADLVSCRGRARW